jgi:hypothetical protein
MKKWLASILFLIPALILSTGIAMAQAPDLDIEFDFDGFGNMILDSPPVYSGDITAGDPLVAGGTWWIQIDDTGWPGTGDPAARWDYIFTNYFPYDPYSFSWTASFDGNTLATKPIWEIVTLNGSTMGGTLVVQVTISDWDMDGVLDVEERTFGVFSGTLMVMKYGTGDFDVYCGSGAYNGSYQNADPINWADDYVEGHCILNLIDCRVGTEEVSWGAIKSIYR